MDKKSEECDEGLSLMEYWEKKQEEEGVINEMFKRKEMTECTYRKGYINQQVFGCITCAPEGNFGFCIGCFFECHLDHDTFEIGVRRNFRCDCQILNCQLQKDQEKTAYKEVNMHNEYDLCFENKFCLCKTRYSQMEGEFMINCSGCQDYFHSYHLGLNEEEQQILENQEIFDMVVCSKCVINKYRLLINYINEPKVVLKLINNSEDNIDPINNQLPQPATLKRSLSKLQQQDCIIHKNYNSKELLQQFDQKPIFLTNSFLENMCQCMECLKIYKDINLDEINELPEDNVKLYKYIFVQGFILDSKFWDKIESERNEQDIQMATDMVTNDQIISQAMKKYDHVTQCNLAYGYNQVKDKIVNFIGSLDQSTPVTIQKLQPLIDQLYSMKRKKTD